MDAAFGPQNFLNEIIWKRTSAHSTAKKYGCNADHILFYGKTEEYTWKGGFTEFDEKFLKRFKRKDPDGRLWYDDNLTGAGTTEGESGQDWRGFSVRMLGRHWRTTPSELDRWAAEDLIYFPPSGGFPRLKRYLDEGKGVPLQSIWTDVSPINSQAAERLGYPTQKPEALLERIIQASSNEGDIVLDPFCGCGTTIAAAQKLKRRWIGIDITHLAITLMKKRLLDAFGTEVKYNVQGEPTSLPDAAALAESDPYQFQWWALGLVGARPVEQKKGADKGIDGKIVFQGDAPGIFEQVILSVKAGHTGRDHVHSLRGVMDGQKAAIGVLISMQNPTGPMKEEAVTAGFFESKTWGKKYPKIQLLTIAELLAGKKIEMPPIKQVGATFKKADKFVQDKSEQFELIKVKK
jgi:DNA modification methylase